MTGVDYQLAQEREDSEVSFQMTLTPWGSIFNKIITWQADVAYSSRATRK